MHCTTPVRRRTGPPEPNPGDALNVGGPRGSFIIPTDFDWHLLVGDETALPAISRRLAELPAGARALVIGEIDGPADEIAFATKADATVIWAHRNGTAAGVSDVLAKKLATLNFLRATTMRGSPASR